MNVKYPNYVNLTSSSEEQPNERTPSLPPRKKSLSPPQAPSKSISSKSTHYTSSSPPCESLTPTHVMAVAAQNTNNMTFRSILLKEKLTGSNFTNCYRNLRIVLRYEKKIKFMVQPTGPGPDPETADPDTIDKYYETINLEQEVACLMLSRGRLVSKLLSLEDEELHGHTGTPRLCYAK
ncbi:hypothetical protein Tco_0594673 [Tanacetum coccineum]